MMVGMDVPDQLRRKAAALGEPGRGWLADLPAVIASLERDWDVTVGPALRGGGPPGRSRCASARSRPARR